jgi:AraC family transcriptional regulator, regulatory protein of adaptative response / methylphosphotriester-DNA alkyltransferase methyltransferase
VTRARKPETRQTRAALYAEALAFMREECAQKLTLEAVARRIATSPRQLQRAFDEAEAPPFQDVLVRVRLERAKDLLAETDMPIYRVAHKVGYQTQSAFTRAFRRQFGVTPTQMRS